MPHAPASARRSDPADARLTGGAGVNAARTDAGFEWMKAFATGVEELDAWHRKLIRDSDDLLSAARNTVPWTVVVERADALARSCVDHFLFEEVLMDRSNFPRREAHREEHRRISNKLWWLADAIRFSDGSGHRDQALPIEFKTLLLDVMVRHDLDFHAHLQAAAGAEPALGACK